MMLTGRRWWTLALIIGLCALATAGCRRKSSRHTTNVNGSDIFTTDNFPGGHVQDNNVSDDKRAMSSSGADYDNNVRVWFNGNRGPAIVSYSVDGGGGADMGITVHYFNGETFTPPVTVRALDQNQATGPFLNNNLVAVAWVNTENHASEAAQARNGDALLFWIDNDHKDVAAAFPASDEINKALFMTYFDVSYSEDVAHRYGFADEANTERIDAQDENGEDVISVGLLSDGLCGQANWFFGSDDYKWGDDTTSVECLFVQKENNSGVLDGTVEDQAMYTVRFDPATVTPEDQPIPGTGLTRLGVITFGASDSGVTSDKTQVDGNFITYNNTVIFRVYTSGFIPSIGPVGFGPSFDITAMLLPFAEDITLQTLSINLDTGAISSVDSFNSVAVVSGDVRGNNAQFIFGSPSVFGSDEGLACTVVYYTMWEDSPTGAPQLVGSAGLWLGEISPSTGGLLEIAQLSVDDANEIDSVSQSDVQIQISRNGDYIWAAWRQVDDLNAGVGNDFSPASDAVYACQYITTRPDGDGLFVIPSMTDTLSGTFIVAAPTVTQPVSWYQFQGYLGYICGLQSDADVMHINFERGDGTIDEVFDARLHADLVPIGVVPSVTVTSFEVFEEGVQTIGKSFQAVDSGDGGGIFAGYTDDILLVGTDVRVFAEDEGPTPGVTEIDSDVTFRQAIFDELVATPPGEEIGTFNTVDLVDEDQRHHGAEIIHSFFHESRTSESYAALAFRTRQFNTNTDATFTDSFVPNVTPATYQEPFMIDLPNIDPSSTTNIEGFAVQGNSVGLWFEFNNRLYYQEFDTNGNGDNDLGWRNINGAGDPALIDDDSEVEVAGVEGLYTQTCTCQTLDRAMIFWYKHFSEAYPGQDRLQVRVRGTDSGNN